MQYAVRRGGRHRRHGWSAQYGEEELVEIEDEWKNSYVHIADDHVPHRRLADRLMQPAQSWRAVTAFVGAVDDAATLPRELLGCPSAVCENRDHADVYALELHVLKRHAGGSVTSPCPLCNAVPLKSGARLYRCYQRRHVERGTLYYQGTLFLLYCIYCLN